jgi:SAM-dependent methyltransferase
MSDPTGDDLRTSYDRVAHEYARRLADELEHKPLDRRLLDRFAGAVRGVGPACDLGCGPGQVARYLHERGVPVVGVDLSPVMVEEARRRNEGIDFRVGDLRSLEFEEGAFAGVVAFYSLIHVPRPEVGVALGEMWRVLRPGGLLLLAFHVGDETVHRDEWWGEPVSVDFHFYRTAAMVPLVRAAGLDVVDVVERGPFPEVEYPSRRAYIFARRRESEAGSADHLERLCR